MKTTYLLKSVVVKKHPVTKKEYGVGTLMMRPDYPINSGWTTIKVLMSPLLLSIVRKNDCSDLNHGDTFIGTPFKSTVNSKDIADNPFKLVQFCPTAMSDIPISYRLEYVTEMRSEHHFLTDAFDRKVDAWKSRRLKPFQYLRYRLVYNTKRLSEVAEGFIHIDPEMEEATV